MKELWSKDEAGYGGSLVRFEPSWCWPKPVQKPHPPIHLGGNGPNTLRRVVGYADGWMPNRGDILGRIPELQRMAEAAGRGRIEVTALRHPGRHGGDRALAGRRRRPADLLRAPGRPGRGAAPPGGADGADGSVPAGDHGRTGPAGRRK
jgi:alkanesulfonate monooxygenase SsuD/methylene tetrahydromethanopterin reductase-like flavin-dependent oxidoreductase (luciferase family)